MTSRSCGNMRRFSEQTPELIGGQSGAFGNRTHGEGIDGIVPGNDQALPTIGHNDMSTLTGDVEAQFFKDADGVLLADTWNCWRDSKGDHFAGKTRSPGFRLALDVFLGDFEPELNSLTDIGQRFIVGRPLTVATRQGGARNRKPFLGFKQDHMILHDPTLSWFMPQIKVGRRAAKFESLNGASAMAHPGCRTPPAARAARRGGS